MIQTKHGRRNCNQRCFNGIGSEIGSWAAFKVGGKVGEGPKTVGELSRKSDRVNFRTRVCSCPRPRRRTSGGQLLPLTELHPEDGAFVKPYVDDVDIGVHRTNNSVVQM